MKKYSTVRFVKNLFIKRQESSWQPSEGKQGKIEIAMMYSKML